MLLSALKARIRRQSKYLEGASPLSLTLASGGDVFLYALKNFRYNGDVNLAAAIAFYAILSSIPLLILTLVVGSTFFGFIPDLQQEVLRVVREFHPGFSESLITQVGQIEEKGRMLGWVGVLTLIWSSSLIFNALQTALNIIFRSPHSRNFFVGKLLAIAMIPMGWTVALLNAAITYVAALIERLPLDLHGAWIFQGVLQGILFKYILPYLVMTAFVTFLYKVIPTGRVRFVNALMGSALFSALLEITKHLFTWYITNRANYDVIYGSLETVVLLVIWVFYVSTILLFCAELVSAYQKRDLILLEKAFLRGRGGAL